MLKFFRRIRRNLLETNNFRKYLVYAIGEILLVVVGILIALQVNNLNEQKKINDKEQKYLLAIKNELINNQNLVKREQINLKAALDAQIKIDHLIDMETVEIDEYQLTSLLIQSLTDEFSLDYESGVFTELLSAGGLSDLSNDEIKNQVASWDGKMNQLRMQEEEVRRYRNFILQYLIEHGDLKTVRSDQTLSLLKKDGKTKRNNSNLPVLKSQQFENLLSLYITYNEVLYNEEYPKLERHINYLLSLVEKDIRLDKSNETTNINTEGVVFWNGNMKANLFYGMATSEYTSNWTSEGGDALCMDYPEGLQWGAVFITVGKPTLSPRPPKDYSKYEKLEIEMKGDEGGEKVEIALKDKDDPDDGSESRKAVELTKEWKTYEFDLKKDFPSASLEQLNIVTSFVFRFGSQSICVRKIYFK